MSENNALVELRFSPDALVSVDFAISTLKDMDIEKSNIVRDPNISISLTVVAAPKTLSAKLIELAQMLRTINELTRIVVSKLKADNSVESLSLHEATDEQIKQFLSIKRQSCRYPLS